MRIWGGQIFLGQNAKGINNKTIDKLDLLQIKKKKNIPQKTALRE